MGAQQLERLRVAKQRQESARDQVGRRLMTTDQGNDRIGNHVFIGEPVAVNLRRHERMFGFESKSLRNSQSCSSDGSLERTFPPLAQHNQLRNFCGSQTRLALTFGLTMDGARKNCEVYKATTEAQQDIQYALPSLEREALLNRLRLIDDASKSLDALLEQTSKMLEAQNATRLMLFNLQNTQIKLEADRADTQSKISEIYVPPLSDQPLKELVAEKQSSEEGEQKALDRLSRQNNWDVVLSVGVHQQVNPVAQGVQPYGEVTVNYNLASRAINRHLDRAVNAHDEWKKVQEGDVVRQMEVLGQQLRDSVTAQEAKLKSLQEENKQIEKNLEFVVAPDTSAAFDFRNQLAAAQLLLQVETADASFRMGRLREYLERNY
jgi:hypothetical protein